jgi:hypothetical protein
MNDLLKLAIDGHGGMRRWEQLSRFRAAVSVTGAIWALKARTPTASPSGTRSRWPLTSPASPSARSTPNGVQPTRDMRADWAAPRVFSVTLLRHSASC